MEEKQSTMYWVVGIIVLVIIVVGIAYSVRNTDESGDPIVINDKIPTFEEQMSEGEVAQDDGFRVLAKKDADDFKDKSLNYAFEGALQDVVGGTASGVSRMNYKDGIFELYAEFTDLPELVDGEFYEGWLVQEEPFEFISTGKIEKVDDVYRNTYQSSKDFSGFTKYVLTVEPNDGNSAPADHVLEGNMSPVE